MPVLSDINAPATLSHPFKAEAGREISARDSCAAAAALLRAIPAMLESRWWWGAMPDSGWTKLDDKVMAKEDGFAEVRACAGVNVFLSTCPLPCS